MKKNLGFVFLVLVSMLVLAATEEGSASTVAVAIQPSEVRDVASGGTFTIDVTISDATELYGWQLNITFNPQVLKAEKVAEGPFLKNLNDTYFFEELDNTAGFVGISSILKPPYPSHGASGNGLLANITFSVKSSGSSSLHFDESGTKLRTVVAGSVVPITDFSTVNGSFSNAAGGLQFGLPFELIVGAVVVVVVVVGAAGFFLWRRRKRAA